MGSWLNAGFPHLTTFHVKHPGGRPSKYKSEFTGQVYKLALLGAKDVELAAFFGVNQDTIVQWTKTIAEFSESRKKGKEHADQRVAKNLFKRANGFHFDEVTTEQITLKDGTEVKPATLTKTVRKLIIPDVTAQIFWLKNRQSDKWRDRQELGVTLAEDQIFEIAGQKIKFG